MVNFASIATVLIICVLLAITGIKILREYERAVIFRLGRLVRARGPGITYVIPLVEKMMSFIESGFHKKNLHSIFVLA